MSFIGPILAIIFSFLGAILGVGYAYQQTLTGWARTVSTAPGQDFSQVSKTMPTPSPRDHEFAVPSQIPGERGIRVSVLLYHYVSENGNKADTIRTSLSTHPRVFEQQLQLLQQNGFTTITFDELAAAFGGTFTMPGKPVILTFDDGYADFYTHVAPLLAKYQMKGIAFIPTGLMGGGNYMTWSQISELSRSPFVVFGAHSVHHWALNKIAHGQLVTELEESKRVLEEHVGYKVNWMAYPYGLFNDAVIAAAKAAGFIGGITTISGSWQYQSRFFSIPRYRVGNRLGADFLKLVM